MPSINTMEKVCLITGGGSGVGRATALALAREGYSIIIAGRRLTQLKETVDSAKESKQRILAIPADVSQPESVRELFTKTLDAFGRLDVLFNNAGMNIPKTPIEDISLEQWQSIVAVNLTGVFLCTQEAVNLMKRQQPMGGRIINNGSISAHVPRPHASAYNATKHAVTGLTKSMSLEGRQYNIACGQIDIGNAKTEMSNDSNKDEGALQANGDYLQEPQFEVEHVAQAVVYMANLPLEANVQFMTVMATKMPYIARG